MNDDARFEDGRDKPLNIGALDEEQLRVISALIQDAVLPIAEMRWDAKRRQFALLLNRFRWERDFVNRSDVERVQSVLIVENVLGVSSQGVDRSDKDTILSILTIGFEAGADAAGTLYFTLAGDGALRISVEALEIRLKDVTRPYRAPSGARPSHDV